MIFEIGVHVLCFINIGIYLQKTVGQAKYANKNLTNLCLSVRRQRCRVKCKKGEEGSGMSGVEMLETEKSDKDKKSEGHESPKDIEERVEEM